MPIAALEDTLDATVSHDTAMRTVERLAQVFAISQPTVYFDDSMPDAPNGGTYLAYAYPTLNEIHFRNEYIPYISTYHEFAHLLYTQYTGNSDRIASESFAQQFAAMAMKEGENLLNFKCPYCGQSQLTVLPNMTLECLTPGCGAQFQQNVFETYAQAAAGSSVYVGGEMY